MLPLEAWRGLEASLNLFSCANAVVDTTASTTSKVRRFGNMAVPSDGYWWGTLLRERGVYITASSARKETSAIRRLPVRRLTGNNVTRVHKRACGTLSRVNSLR